MEMNGILLVDKPDGWTSHDVVAKLRGILRERKIGHSGTLDPMATGLLVVFVGRATKAVEFAESNKKRYIATLRLGLTTNTQDTSGDVLTQCATDGITESQLDAAIDSFRGDIEQIPPMYSAIKVDGQRLYKLARRGEIIERAARKICIHSLERLSPLENGEVGLDIECSKGTYIRTLCHDIGQQLECGGAMSSLRRVSAGVFSVSDAYTLEQLEAMANEGQAHTALMQVESLFSDWPVYTADEAQEYLCRTGRKFEAPLEDGDWRVVSQSGVFLMLAKAEAGVLRSIKNFF